MIILPIIRIRALLLQIDYINFMPNHPQKFAEHFSCQFQRSGVSVWMKTDDEGIIYFFVNINFYFVIFVVEQAKG